jgi:copper resistance protein C
MKNLIGAASLALLLAHPDIGLAHTSVAGTTPKNGSELTQSPPSIEITFRGEARLTSVTAIGADKNERKLDFMPKTSATAFKIANPDLKQGRNEIHWKALSKDGHVVSGSLVLTISPKAP